MLKTDLILPAGYDPSSVREAILAELPLAPNELRSFEILKKELLLRDGKVFYKLSVGILLDPEREVRLARMRKKVFTVPPLSLEIPPVGEGAFAIPPLVVGAGPCGLFAALLLAEAGARPVVIERGLPVEERKKSVQTFYRDRVLDPDSNIQFGEGGAGAFSDGKLKVGSMDAFKRKVLSTFVDAGAPEDILYLVGAHLGTDRLPRYVAAIREKIRSLGGSFLFRTKLVDLLHNDGRVCAAECERTDNGERFTIPADTLILATGHSAKDTYEMLLSHSVAMESRGFGIGLRVEHPREWIDRLAYGDTSLAKIAGTASYHLVTHLAGGRSVYSFCMCPGGSVVAAASEPYGVVTNGMSEFARMGDLSNAAHLVSIGREDFASDHPLAGFALQKKIEEAAYRAAGGDYSAPAIRMADFMSRASSLTASALRPSYPLGTRLVAPENYLPEKWTNALRAGFLDFEERMPGFLYGDAVLTGPETRSTSPVRILRGEDGASLSLAGLYPVGEGAGYSGGIVSSAVDGLRVSYQILQRKVCN